MNLIRQGYLQIKKVVKRILRKGYYPDLEYKCRVSILGSDYGEWGIPVDFIKSSNIIYSFGVGEDISFELELIDKFGVNVHAFDPTPKSIKWIGAQSPLANFMFYPIGLADYDGVAFFLPPDNIDYASYKMTIDRVKSKEISLPVKKLATIMNELGHASIDILKMDIEGTEYDVIFELKETNIRPKIILVEFHHRWQEVGVNKTIQAINILRLLGYKLFYVSAREEYGFLLMEKGVE